MSTTKYQPAKPLTPRTQTQKIALQNIEKITTTESSAGAKKKLDFTPVGDSSFLNDLNPSQENVQPIIQRHTITPALAGGASSAAQKQKYKVVESRYKQAAAPSTTTTTKKQDLDISSISNISAITNTSFVAPSTTTTSKAAHNRTVMGPATQTKTKPKTAPANLNMTQIEDLSSLSLLDTSTLSSVSALSTSMMLPSRPTTATTKQAKPAVKSKVFESKPSVKPRAKPETTKDRVVVQRHTTPKFNSDVGAPKTTRNTEVKRPVDTGKGRTSVFDRLSEQKGKTAPVQQYQSPVPIPTLNVQSSPAEGLPGRTTPVTSPRTKTATTPTSGATGELVHDRLKDLELMETVLLQICYMNAVAQKTFSIQQHKALLQLWNGWCFLQQRRADLSQHQLEVERQKNIQAIEHVLTVQGPVLEQLVSKFHVFKQHYDQFARLLSHTTHKLPVEGIETTTEGVDEQLATTVKKSKDILLVMHSELRVFFEQIRITSELMEQLTSAVLEAEQECSTSCEDLESLKDLESYERSLIIQNVQETSRKPLESTSQPSSLEDVW